jgi:hypothetical protein
MSWHHITADWPSTKKRLRRRFPHLCEETLDSPPRDRGALTRHLATTHHLTLFEAREELDDFLHIESLARRVMNMPGR